MEIDATMNSWYYALALVPDLFTIYNFLDQIAYLRDYRPLIPLATKETLLNCA